MYNFRIDFSNPWLLFALVPVIFFALFHYFRTAKKYRRNRNRITSLVLHLVAMSLCVCVLAGFTFRYDVPNSETQIILLVDMSDSGMETESKRDDVVANILQESGEQFNIGVVTFGYDQVVAAPFSYNTDSLYNQYRNAPLPNTTATDIASALRYAKSLFSPTGTSKIVLISDGIETDGDAQSAVLSIAATGTRVDTVAITRPETDEVEIVSVTTPDYNVAVDDPFDITLHLLSSIEGRVFLTIYDGEMQSQPYELGLTTGAQEITVQGFSFSEGGMHTLRFEIANNDDTLTQNNTYYSYINIAVCDRVLVFERNDGEADNVVRMLQEGTGYTVDKINVRAEANKMPTTVDALRMYDEVVMVNVGANDMPEGFDKILNTYVQTYGGGLFTVGGNEDGDTANLYNKEYMEGTLYQQMLPVQVIDYTPPIAVMFLIDVSGSMDWGNVGDKSYLEVAKEAIRQCVQFSLSERDYCGIMTLGEPPTELSPLLPVPQMSKILEGLNKTDENLSQNGTPYGVSVAAAGKALMSRSDVEKRHIIIMSDGDPTDDGGFDSYVKPIQQYAALGVTTTIVNVGNAGANRKEMEDAAAAGNGHYIYVSDITALSAQMRNELESKEIKSVNYKDFTPQIRAHTSVVSGIKQEDMPILKGFYGTKLKANATAVLMGEYVPIYAQWKYGKGSVGSFMCDLNGNWSEEFVDSDTGKLLVKNIIASLFPSEDIRPSEIDIRLTSENYSTVMNVFTEIETGDKIEAEYRTLSSSGEEIITPIIMDPNSGYTHATFAITQPGIHKVTVRKTSATGQVKESSVYHVLSYSDEYEVLTVKDGVTFMETLAARGKGNMLEDMWEAFEGMDGIEGRVFDPRILFCVIALALFLLDIAVRKFKFKWIHELIREHKAKKSGGKVGEQHV